jgi:hypothetical protein
MHWFGRGRENNRHENRLFYSPEKSVGWTLARLRAAALTL